jgi:molecular chaperone HtpG
MSYESTLKDVLEKKSPELSGRLPKIRDVAETLLSYTQGKFPYYTPHDFSHSLNVEENLNWIIPDKIKEQMTPNELFFLIVAAWMHDWGMVGKADEKPEDIRETHYIRTENYFEELYSKLFLTEHEGRIIGRISKGHTKTDLSSTDYDDEVYGASCRIRRRFLAALLRIADECDIAHNRTPEVLYFTLNPTGKSKEEFEKHLSIGGVGQLEEKHKIYISATAREPRGAKLLRMVEEKIQHEIDSVKSILASNGITLDTVELRMQTRGFVDKPIGFEVNNKKIVELLMGEHLYQKTVMRL